MAKMCCMSLTMAVKLIGTYGMSLSILMINVLVSNFFSSKEEEKFIIAVESWMLFGLNWTFVMKSIKVAETARTLLTCVLIYSSLSLVANALLTLGSLLKKPDYLLPWMYMQMVSIIDQTISLGIQLSNEDSDSSDKSTLYIPACSVYLLLSSYFWMVVSAARREYIAEAENDEERAGAATPSAQLPNNFNMPKTPSYLSSNITHAYDQPPPIAPPKYEVV